MNKAPAIMAGLVIGAWYIVTLDGTPGPPVQAVDGSIPVVIPDGSHRLTVGLATDTPAPSPTPTQSPTRTPTAAPTPIGVKVTATPTLTLSQWWRRKR